MENLTKIKNTLPEKLQSTGLFLTDKEREEIAGVLMEAGYGDVRELLARLRACVRRVLITPKTLDAWMCLFDELEDEFLR